MASRFRPDFWPTVFLVPALALMIGLGVWQLERLAWKTDLIDRIERGLAAPPVPLPARLDDPGFDYRRVTVTGRFDAVHAFPLLARVHDGAAGIQVVTPLLRDDDGPAVMINRGWVPLGPDGKPAAFAAALNAAPFASDVGRPRKMNTCVSCSPLFAFRIASARRESGNAIVSPALARAAGIINCPRRRST